MESPSFPSQDAPTVTAPTMTPPPVAPAPFPSYAPAPGAPQPRRSVALGMLLVFAVALAIAGVVTSSLSSALGQARVIAYPRPSIAIVFSGASGAPRVGDTLSFSVDIKAGHDLAVTWDFGDNSSPALGPSVTHSYETYGTYTVVASAGDPIGQRTSATYQLQVLPQLPRAQFTATSDPNDPFTMDFDASGSSGGTSLVYNWDFGDGQTDTGDGSPTTSNTYSKLGSYQVTLTVTDQANQTSEPYTQTVNVTLPKPKASFSWTNDSPYCYGGDYVSFDASASTGYQLTYSWDYGDGNTDSGSSTYNYFSSTGYYTVTLTVTDAGGQTASSSQSVYAC